MRAPNASSIRSIRPYPISQRPCCKYQAPQTRPFTSTFETKPQTLSTTRILHYEASSLYNIISDVNSYKAFLPYCQQSRVTQWSKPDASGKQWPMEGELEIGWGGYEESFRSRVYCVPERIVEAVGGEATTSVRIADRMAFESDEQAAQPETPAGIELSVQAERSQILSHLLTRWTIRPFPFKPPPENATPQEGKTTKSAEPRTEVNLVVEFKFASPVYAALSQAVAPKITGIMIEAFEKRAQELLGELHADSGHDPKVESLRMKP